MKTYIIIMVAFCPTCDYWPEKNTQHVGKFPSLAHCVTWGNNAARRLNKKYKVIQVAFSECLENR